MPEAHEYSYDPECEKLARHFMPHGSDAAVRELAQMFQEAVECFEYHPDGPDGPHYGEKIY